MAKTTKTATSPSEPAPVGPFLAAIRDEARRLEGGFLASSGHVSDALGAPFDSPEGEGLLFAFAEANGLDVGHDGRDGLLFARRTGPTAREATTPPMPAAPPPAA